jgi:hypothetical protein
MSYHHRHARRTALGASAAEVATTVQNLVKTLGPGLNVAAGVINDPAFPTVLARLKTIKQLAEQEAARRGASSTASVGLGLKKFVPPLDAYIYIQRKPWVLPVGAAAALTIPFLLGFWLGRGRH